MTLLILSISCIVGLFFGSFASVIITRLRSKKPGILNGRSECPACHTRLSPSELIPLISYISSLGKCRTCRTPISSLYPLLEIAVGIAFASMAWVLLSHGVSSIAAWVVLAALTFVTILYAVYDMLYMEVPDEVLVPAMFLLVLLLVVATLLPSWGKDVFWYFPSTSFLSDALLGGLILYSFFYLQILIPWVIYALKRKKYTLFQDILLWYFLFPFTLPRLLSASDTKDEAAELPTWVWAGDLRIALFIGLSLGWYLSLWSLAFTYIFGAVIGSIILSVVRRFGVRIPFWPLLAGGWFLALWLSGTTEYIVRSFVL